MARKATKEEEGASGGAPASFPGVDARMTRMMAWPVELWLRSQADMIKAAEPVATGWLERRREDAEAALRALERLSTCPGLSDAATVQREWLDGAMRRLEADMRALTGPATFWSHETITAAREATERLSEAATSATQWAVQKEEKAAASE